MPLKNFSTIFILWVCSFTVLSAQTTTLHFSFSDGIGKRGETYAYPLKLSDTLTVADSLYSGQLTVTHNNTVFDIVGIQKTGTMLSSVADVQFNPATGILAFSNTQPITGTGIFIDFLITIKPTASGASVTSLQNMLINEGNLSSTISNGSMRPMDIFITPKNPPQDRIVGDTIQFTVSGDVHPPVTWSVGDTHVVSIDGSGRVIGKNIGQTTVTVTDTLGLSDHSSLFPIHPATLRSLTISVPETTVMQNLTFLLPIKVSTVTGLGITSAQFRLSYHPSLLIPLGVIKSGTMTNAWTEPTVFYGSNYIDVAMAGTEALNDSGTLVYVQFKVKRYANFNAPLSLSNVLFNENLNATISNGYFYYKSGPVISISGTPTDMIVGETAPLFASGGTMPYRWKMLSDVSIASIDSISGLLTAKQKGYAVYAAVDANGFDGIDSILIADVRFRFLDTTFIYTDTIDYPITVSSLTGQSVVSTQFVLHFDTSKIRFVSALQGGTLTNGMAMEINDSAGLRFALSSVTPLSGAGTFIVLRFASKGLLSVGHVQPMFFSQMMLNENGATLRTYTQKPGSISITNVPNYPPVFTAKLRDTTINENQILQVQLSASDANGDSLLFGIFNGLSGMTMTGKGFFSWQPNFAQSGTYKVLYDVGDYHADGVTRDSAVITVVDVNRIPFFSRPMNDTTIHEEQSLAFDIDAVDPDGTPLRYSLIGGSPGMNIDSLSGKFSWFPTTTQAGVYPFTIKASDLQGGSVTDPVTVTVLNLNILPVFTQYFTDTTISENQPFQFSVKAADQDGDIVHYYIQNIQPGMNIDTNTGVITWRPTFSQSGVYNIGLAASDGIGSVVTIPASITVLHVNRIPIFTGTQPDTIMIVPGQTVNVQFTGTDPDNDPLVFSLVEGPQGASMTQAGIFSWGPAATQAGLHQVIIALSDGTADIRDTLYINVVSGNTPPQLTHMLPDTTIEEGQLLFFQYAATDSELDSLHWTLVSEVPNGLTLSSKGLLTWSPKFDQSGMYTVIVSVNDSTFDVADTARISVLNVNQPPTFTGTRPESLQIETGQSVNVQFTATDADNDQLVFSLVEGPQGSSMTQAGIFHWSPVATQVGMHRAIIALSDGTAEVRDTLLIVVVSGNTAPALTRILPDTTINEGQLLSFQYTAKDSERDSLHWFLMSDIPNGLTLSPEGLLMWSPKFYQSGLHSIVVGVRDSHFTVSDTAIITVLDVNGAPVFYRPMNDTTIRETETLVFDIDAIDPDGTPVKYALQGASVGMKIDSNSGAFTWTPSVLQAGQHAFSVRAIDLLGGTATDGVTITVLNTNVPPEFTNVFTDTTISENQLLSFMLKAKDADGDIVRYSIQNIQPGMSIDSTSGVISWRPSFIQSGKHAIEFIAADGNGGLTHLPAVITVTNSNRPPQFTATIADTAIFVDSNFTFHYSGNDADGDTLAFSLIKYPAGAAMTQAGTFTWKPVQVLRETVIVSLSDGIASVRDSAIITVQGIAILHASTTDIDFGTTVFGSFPVKQLGVKNTGRVPLILTKVTGLPNEHNFTSNALSQSIVDPGKEVFIAVTFTPQQIGSHVSSIAFQTNDPNQPYFGVLLKGMAISVATVKRKLLVDLSHLPRIALQDSLNGMTQLFGALRNSGIDVTFADSALLLNGYDAVLLVAPRKQFTVKEKATLRQFIQEGGLAVLMEDVLADSHTTIVNDLLRDSLLASGMEFQPTVIVDSANNYLGNPFAPMITKFADIKHPYLNGVDSIVCSESGVILTDSTAIPFASVTTSSDTVKIPGKSAAVIGLKKNGKGTIVAIGNTSLWRNTPPFNEQIPFNIAAKDNFTFALNLFSVKENYLVSMPEKTPNEVYQLISIPLELNNVDILSVLKASLGEINPLKWRLFGKFNPVTERYREFPSAGFSTFNRGEAYWLITRGEFALDFGSATILPAQDYYPITIGPGYSMIGNPFPYPISWKNSRKGDSVQTVLWRFDPTVNTFAPESLMLAPFSGYFVKNISQDSVTIYINPQKVQLAKQGISQSFTAQEWRINIGATSGKAADNENYAGVSVGANEELDRFDMSEPPTTPTDYIRLRFTNQQWRKHRGSYAADIRPINTEGLFWEFDVSAAKGQSKIRLTLDKMGTLPADFGLYLLDKVTERVTRFDRTLFYEFTMEKNLTRHQFRLVAGNPDFVEKNTNGIPLMAMEFELRQNYPNPFNPSTFIYYTIGHSGNVQLEVFNVLGQKVRMLRNELQQIGSYTIEWDGKDEAGELVASGVYFYKVTVTNNNEKLFAQTKKMIMMK